MREIKFKAWHINEKRFVDAELLPQSGWCIEEDDLDFSQLEDWQQFTGLKDKNGKEIYEGDVVRFDDRLGNVVVSYNHDGYTLQSRVYSESKEVYERRSLANATRLAIIGNIYENPELLKA